MGQRAKNKSLAGRENDVQLVQQDPNDEPTSEMLKRVMEAKDGREFKK